MVAQSSSNSSPLITLSRTTFPINKFHIDYHSLTHKKHRKSINDIFLYIQKIYILKLINIINIINLIIIHIQFTSQLRKENLLIL